MKLLTISNIRLLLIFLAVIFLYVFAIQKNTNRNLLNTDVVFVGENTQFLQQETVNNLLIENKNDLKTTKKLKLNLDNLETTVNKHPMIEKSEVYVTIDGVLKARVTQKTPVARVFENEYSYYIDKNGTKMPLSKLYSARVPIISGGITKNRKEIIEILDMIQKDDFLKKNIIGITIEPNQSLTMENRNFDYEIDFGKPIYIEKKFKNYKAFFQKAIEDSSLYNYKKINLKYTQQVVCSK